MKRIDVGQSAQILANVAVLLGIVFLALEIRQSVQATRASSRDAALSQSLSFFEQRLDNQIIAEAEFKLMTGEELDGFERYQLRSFQYFNFRTFENIFLNYESGLFSESEWVKYRDILVEVLETNEIAMDLWVSTPGHWSPEFREEVTARLSR
jgi:hypothetical protein